MIDNSSKEDQKTYVMPAIFVTLFAFFPVGIFALKYALEAKNYYNTGNFSDAKRTASKAKKLTTIGFLIAITIYLFGAIGWIYSYSNTQKKLIQKNLNPQEELIQKDVNSQEELIQKDLNSQEELIQKDSEESIE